MTVTGSTPVQLNSNQSSLSYLGDKGSDEQKASPGGVDAMECEASSSVAPQPKVFHGQVLNSASRVME